MYRIRALAEYHWYLVQARVRLFFRWCPACPRRIKQGHKMDCSWGWRK